MIDVEDLEEGEEGECKMGNLKVIRESEDFGIYLLEIPYYLANSLRRIIIEEIPTLRIEDVYIKRNFSHLYDEMLAHRLGLLVLRVNKEGIKEAKLALKERGKKMVYAKDIKVLTEGVEVLYPETPIVYLDNDFQEVDLEMVAKWGIGKEHIKFKPAHVWFKYYPKIIYKKEKLSEEEIKIIEKKLPKEIYEIKDGKILIKEDKLIDYDIGSLLDDEILEKYLEYRGDENRIVFYIESFGDYKPRELLRKAKEIFLKKIEEFEKKVEELIK